jgi:hypothetical protein
MARNELRPIAKLRSTAGTGYTLRLPADARIFRRDQSWGNR